ncbi:MAG: hypothetical protein J1F12_07540 [Muribaculaceae bacterium]|nr:hypothetical protein [Muribaculaceae bacterium]
MEELEEAEYINFDAEGLKSSIEYTLAPVKTFNLKDSANYCSLYIMVRYTDSCLIRQLPLSVEYSLANSNAVSTDKINIPLFDQEGVSYGHGNLTLYETSYLLKENAQIDNCFYLSFETPEKNTEGIISVGIKAIKKFKPYETHS